MAKKVAAAGPVEGTWALPEGWRWERLGSILPLSYGKALKATERRGGSVAVYGSSGVAGSHDEALCSEPALIVGRKGSAGAVFHASGPFYAIDTTYYCSTSAARFDLRLGYHLLSFLDLRKLDQSTAVPSLSRDSYNELIVPVPPDSRQSEIAARIDELFAEINDGEAALARACVDLTTWRKALLKAAVTGELTADWRAANPTSETGSDLQASILAERREHWQAEPRSKRKTYTEPIGTEAAGLPALPGSWTWLSIQQLATVVRGASPRPAGDPLYFGGDIPWITVGSLTKDNAKHLTSVDLFVTPLGREHSRFVEAGTLLFTNSGATLGVPKITSIGGCINDGLVALLELDDPLKSYVYYFLRTQTERLRALNQGAAQPNLNTTIVKEIAIPVPPLTEMIELIAILERLLVEVEAGEDDLQHLRTAPATLSQSILAAAFRGELA